MKRILCLALSLAMILSLSACGGQPAGGSSSSQQPGSASSAGGPSGSGAGSGASSSVPDSSGPASSAPDGSGASSSAGAGGTGVGDIKVDSDTSQVTIVVPAGLMVGDMSQKDLDEGAKKAGYDSITLNEDGSATYVMSKEKHQEMLSQLKASVDANVKALNDSAPKGVVSVEANSDLSVIAIKVDSDTVPAEASFAALSLSGACAMYNAFNGTGSDGTKIQYVNDATGQVIQEISASGMQ